MSERETERPEEIEISPQRSRSWRGLVSYLLVFIAVAVGLGWLLERFTNSVIVAVGLVGFMIAYMTIVALVTAKNLRGP